MKRNLQLIVTASAASILTFSALAQDTPNPRREVSDHTLDRMPRSRANQLNGTAKSSDLIGMTVKNRQNEKLGKVEDLAVDVESGRIVEVIVSTGGFIGIDNTLIAVPPRAFDHDVADKVLRLDIDKEKLKNAPKFDNAKWDEGTQSNRVTEIYTFYGERPYFVMDREGALTTDNNQKPVESLPRNLDGTINTDGARTQDKINNKETAENVERNTRSVRNADGTWTHEYSANGDGPNHSWSRLGYVQKASKVTGMTVKNMQDEKLGKVENLAVDITSGRIVAVIISSGGFLGMGNELSAVPPTALKFNPSRDALQLDATKDMLVAAPHFKSKEWPDLSEPHYTAGVYRAYKVEPYFSTDVDNTRQNVRDRDNRTLTPTDQGGSKADRDITVQIRKEIIAEKGLSINARNVKIITVNGRVTLRGAVNSPEENRQISEIANRVARPENVDNQLETKLVSDNK